MGPVVSAGCPISRDAVAADVGAALVYVTTDCWESQKAYEEFREKFKAEYAELDRICEGLTVGEKHLSEYET